MQAELTDDQKRDAVIAYLTVVVTPLLDDRHRDALRITHGQSHSGEAQFLVEVPRPAVRYLVGRNGRTAEALRQLLRAYKGTLQWRDRTDIIIREC